MSKYKTIYSCEAYEEVQYSFVCEKCGKNSVKKYCFFGQSEKEVRYQERIQDEELHALLQAAMCEVDGKIEAAKKGEYNPFQCVCPWCNQIPSWDLSNYKDKLKKTMATCWAVALSPIFLFLKRTHRNYIGDGATMMIIIIGIGISSIISLVLGALIMIRKAKISNAKSDFFPTVYWDTMQEKEIRVKIIDIDSKGKLKIHILDDPDVLSGTDKR